jgi:hypothetical protein
MSNYQISIAIRKPKVEKTKKRQTTKTPPKRSPAARTDSATAQCKDNADHNTKDRGC